MTPEDLLKPRYKVIADYPGSIFIVGDILPNQFSKELFVTLFDKVDKYPHLFKKLQWWEERKEDEMPEYVKRGERIYNLLDADENYPDRFMFDYPMTEHWVQYTDCLPATEEEFNTQKQNT